MHGLRIVLAVVGLVALTAGAQAQMGQSILQGGAKGEVDRREGGAPPPPRGVPTKRANEKDYKSSLDRLPDQKYDPWAKTR